jgi:hypothetical protein
MYKITDSYNSADIPTANTQIPSSETAHVHGYKVTYDEENFFQSVEISDIQMDNYDAFWPIWTWNDPASHIHPVNTAWSGALDTDLLLGSSAGWYYDEVEEQWMPYDIGADTPWAPPADDDADGYTYIQYTPVVSILGANVYGENTHIHYFDSSVLDTFGDNSGRLATPLTRVQAEELANGVVNEVIIYSSITSTGDHDHYHKYKILWNASTQQFLAQSVGEFIDTLGTGEWTMIDEVQKNHEHTLTVDGITTNLGWNGTPLFTAPDVTLGWAHDWNNYEGDESEHLHSFSGTILDTIGANTGRASDPLNDEQTTDLINGDVEEVIIYSSIYGDHYHGVKITYDNVSLTFIAEDTEQWVSSDFAQFNSINPRSHAHTTEISNLLSINGFNEELVSNDLPIFASPGYPYPGGSHPHFHNGTVVGPFAWNNEIDYADGLTIQNAMDLINGDIEEVVVYDSIEGAHFHDYKVRYDNVNNVFYCDSSITWIKGGIEDIYQDPLKFYVSDVLNESEGLHWHNLTIEWNPEDEDPVHQLGGSVYVTRSVTSAEVLTSDPQTSISIQETILNPETNTYTDTPNSGDTTVVTTYSKLVNTTTYITTTVVTTTTVITYYSDGSNVIDVGNPITSQEQSASSIQTTVEITEQRQTRVNTILQANSAPIVWITGTFIDGEGTHDHLLYEGCTLDTQGAYNGRMCEPLTVTEANTLVNAQDTNTGIVFYDSPNGAASHYHGYKIIFNPYIGTDGEFQVTPINQWDQVPGTGTTIHKFLLTGGFHQHDYWITVTEYTQLVTGSVITTQQRDTIHSDLYQHEIEISYNGNYNLVSQTSNVDGHNLISYVGQLTSGGEWVISTQGAGIGDHIHSTVIDESSVWPVVV